MPSAGSLETLRRGPQEASQTPKDSALVVLCLMLFLGLMMSQREEAANEAAALIADRALEQEQASAEGGE